MLPVLIAGGGPVGLALAIDLALRGIRSVVVEQRDGSVNAPKMSAVSARSMEFCRRWGVTDAIEREGWPPTYPQDFVYVTGITGYELARSPFAPYAQAPERAYTPHTSCHCPQIYFDPILQRRAAELDRIEVRYRTHLDAFTDAGDHVRARLRALETGVEETLAAAYLVGCDGAESAVRERLGIRFLGEGRLSSSLSIYFRSPELARIHDKGWARFYRMLDESGHWADLVAIDGRELWRLTLLDLDGPAAAAAVDVDATVRRAAGRPFAYEVLSTLAWERRDQLAEHYGRGRTFIAGDAAHILSPTGGLGMNTGIGDAADLSWKIQATLDGWGGPQLLATYELERRATAQLSIDASTAYFRRTRRLFPKGEPYREDSPAGAAAREHFARDLATMEREGTLYVSEHLKIGYCYEGSPICVADGTPPPVVRGMDYIPNARPGARAPHVWLDDGRSLLDLFGDGFVLLRLGAAPDPGPLVAAARERGVPLRVVDLDRPDALALYERALVLVRPDGHVAWRGDALPDDPGELIDVVRGSRAAATLPAG
jgi:2-polyprenyl-6-methoxyphenol hydroxylase-like FAD-dependent oxidoreductase